MKRVIQAVLIVAFILAAGFFIFFLARMRRESLEASLPVAERIVDVGSSPAPAGEEGAAKTTSQRAKITAEWGETFLDAVDMNLDEDEDLEQVVIVKPSSENGLISVVVADVQPATGTYVRVWKGETLATKPTAVLVQPRDLVGDGSIDLLCFGIDAANRQTLTVFRRAGAGAYRTVFKASGLSISIEEPAPAASASATIAVYEEAPGGASPLDQRKIVYAWSRLSRRFERSADYLIPGENVEKRFVGSVVTGNAKDFETYLKGLWVRESAAPDPQPPTYLYFDPEGRKISIDSAREQQQWDWGQSTAAFAGIYAPIVNGTVPEMIRVLGIDLVGVDKVRITATTQQVVKFAVKEDWNGVYRRYAGEGTSPGGAFPSVSGPGAMALPIEGAPGAALSLGAGGFDGFYADGAGSSLELSGGDFALKVPGGASKGRYTLFRDGDRAVLDLELVDDRSIPSGRLSYLVSVRPGKGGKIGTLILSPARILEGGAEPLYKPEIRLTRFAD
ncbi:pallilysin-related adhesin [bacterium]|nr:pallilysin-related adhesin [bacterium]